MLLGFSIKYFSHFVLRTTLFFETLFFNLLKTNYFFVIFVAQREKRSTGLLFNFCEIGNQLRYRPLSTALIDREATQNIDRAATLKLAIKRFNYVWCKSNTIWVLRRRWIRPICKCYTSIWNTSACGVRTSTSSWRFWR